MSRIVEADEFDVCGDLPEGITVLEASAGTGKTYAIAALATRYVADGTPLDQLLLVTFGRMATGELRERVRKQLVATEQALARRLAGGPVASAEPVIAMLVTGTEDEIAIRRERVRRALSEFDAATIATTHAFCQGVLESVGMAADLDPDTTFAENVDDLLDDVVNDLFVRRFYARDTPPFDRRGAMQLARIAVYNPLAPIEPRSAPDNSVPSLRMRMAGAVRQEMELRKRRQRLMSYDDLLTRVRSVLVDQPAIDVGARLRSRHRVVLIDEFQDTDPVQWEIVRRAFGQSVTLILVADPKQAIYAFRGADVYSYLDAYASATSRATLRTNWRSDQALIDAYDALFDGATLGEKGILYRRVEAAEANREPRLVKAPVTTPLRVRMVDRSEPTVALTPSTGAVTMPSAREHIAQDVAADIVQLLSADAQFELRDLDGSTRGRERVQPAHIAVLVQRHIDASLVRDELEKVDVPAVINGAGSVFATSAAREWLRLLQAVERPTSVKRARSAALTPFIGWTAERLAEVGEEEWELIHGKIHQWAGVLRSRGVASLMAAVNHEEDVPARVLSQVEGERHLTDIRHVGQLLHGESVGEGLGAAALTDWLQKRIAEAESPLADEERSRRLESDAEAVQILTIHRSKGLEFPFVYCPFLWRAGPVDKNAPVYFHDPDADDRRTLDVGVGGPGFAAHFRQHLIEQRGEELRLMYVALTRAQLQCVIWWAPQQTAGDSPLGRLLFAADGDGNIAHTGPSAPPGDDQARARVEQLCERAPGAIVVEDSTLGAAVRWEKPPPGGGALSAASFDRGIDWTWRRTSFSDITAGSYEPVVASEPRESVFADEPEEVSVPAAGAHGGDDALKAIASPFENLPVSLQFGTLVHQILERTDFAAADLVSELGGVIAGLGGPLAADPVESERLAGAIARAIETPLGPLLDGATLREIDSTARLDELGFELPIAGGDQPDGYMTLAAIAEVLAAVDDPRLRAYATRLGDPSLRSAVRGYLAGSIDLVGRIDGDHGPRYFVVDYKTNWLGPPGDDLTAWHYRPTALAQEMSRHHYLLQGCLYATAVHRYLRWRVPDYDPEQNFAGVHYLFLRGMSGAETPAVGGQPCGVFSWRPSASVLDGLSEALHLGVER